MIKPSTQAGFSAVELLISLFIAVAFVGAGYQLYALIIKNGGEARLRSRADNIAYETLRTYSPQATSPCSTVTPVPTPTLPAVTSPNGLPDAAITVTFTCPYGTSDKTSKLSVRITYGTPQKEVNHATFITP
jgi:Tfp pilus assembly protein PilV